MRRKRNTKNIVIPSVGYIKKYFGSDIGKILVPNSRSLQNCETPYVHHEEAENILSDCLIGDPLKDKSLVFTGLTGSGKTTILRHVFGLDANANKSVITGETIIIPIDFNRAQSSAQDAILSSLRSAIQKISDLCGIPYPDIDNESFYQYVQDRRDDFLRLNPKHTQNTPNSDRMDTFLETLPTTFASCQLQYIMDQPQCHLKLVILIVDNIEAFLNPASKNKKERYLSPVIEAFKLCDCIDQRGVGTKWCYNMIIACRHHIWRIMKGEFTDNNQESALLQSYVTTETPYDLANPVKVNDIVLNREEIFSRKQRNSEKWNHSIKIVNTILHTMENSIGDFVLQLELKDLRKSMSRMRDLILHKGLQKKTDEEIETGAFNINSVEQFDISRVNLIRTIGLGNLKYYSDLNSVIPNLLFNEQQEGLELYPLLTLNYFLTQCGYSEPSWDNPVSIPEFYNTMKNIFGYSDSELHRFCVRSVHFLLQHRLLLRSADQPQDEVPGLSLEDVKKIEHVYVSGSAVKLWEELGKSSALFQLYIDDVWLDEEWTDFFEEDGNDIEHCLKYLSTLQRAEQKIYNRARNRSAESAEMYVETFGHHSLCKQLINGLIASLETICVSGDPRLQIRIKIAKETLKKAKEQASELMEWEQAM